MFLGNIVSEQPIIQDGLFYNTNTLEDVDINIPTLIIGWDFSKRLFISKKLSILDKNIDKNISWTFSRKEKRIDYEKDLKFFIKNSLIQAEKRVNYKYINVLTQKYTSIKNIVKKLTSNEHCYIYIYKNSFIYAYFSGTIIGLDFNSIDYIQVERKKVYKILYSNGNKVIFNDDFLPSDIRESIDNKQRIIPYLYAIQNDRRD
jgi:hypothetical protein